MPANKHHSHTLTLSLLAALLLPVAIVGTRWGIWPFRFAFLLILASAVLAIVTLFVITLSYVRGRGVRPLSSGKKLALVPALVPVVFLVPPIYLVMTHPVIHDITTDWHNPPDFVELSALRLHSDHSAVYQGEEVAQFQRKAYPDILPVDMRAMPAQVHERVRTVLESMGLEIVADEPGQGRIEAIANSGLFGFKDDVTVRIQPTEAGTRVDIRSMSRIGDSDLGANARRVRKIIKALDPESAHQLETAKANLHLELSAK